MRTGITLVWTIVAMALLGGCASPEPPPPPPPEISLESEEAKIFYALGLAQAEIVRGARVRTDELPIFEAGFGDGVLRRELRGGLGDDPATRARIPGRVQVFAERRAQATADLETAAGASLLEDAAAQEGAIESPSGLVMNVMRPGSGAAPTSYDWVKLHYRGTLRDGSVFDSTGEEPAIVWLRNVLPCIAEALQRLEVGGKAQVVCPPTLGYGIKGLAPHIKPGAVLAFEVELLEIVKDN